MQKDLNYTIEILEIEKLKLYEQLDYMQQQISQLTNEYSDKILEKDEELVITQVKMQQIEKLNNELLYRLHGTKKSEEQLNNANFNFISLQKKLDHFMQENQKLEQKVKNLQEQSNQFQLKWQRVSQQLKQATTQRVSSKTLEQQLSMKQEECSNLKERLVQVQLELTIIKQSEQEYKQSIHQKMQSLYTDLRSAQQSLLENTYVQQDCNKCDELMREVDQLRSIVNQDNVQQEQNRINIQINQQLQQQVKEFYDRVLELEIENQNLQKQIKLPETMNNLRNSGSSQIRSISNHPTYVKLTKLIEQLREPVQQELFRKSLHDLGKEMEIRENKEQQLQECKTMYDRLLIKYYALQKSVGKMEDNINMEQKPLPQYKTNYNSNANTQTHPSKQQTQQKKAYQIDSFLQEQETTKQMKQQSFSNTPKQKINNRLNLSLDSNQFKQ